MKNRAVLFLLISVMCSLVFCLAGCGSQSKETSNETMTLEKYVADNPETKDQLEKQLEDSSNDATIYDVEFEGNCMVITGTISIQYSEDDIAATEKYFDSLSQQNADLQIDLIEESTGLTGLTVRYIFLDAEGTEVFSKEYSKSE